MSTDAPRLRRLALALALGGLLFLSYFITYSGVPRSIDELFIMDTTDTFAIRPSAKDLQLNQTVYERTDLQTTDVEPAQPLLSVPLYWVAYHLPFVGNAHALFLFNPIITTLTTMLLFYYVGELGYSERTALVAALLFGLTTIAWPYANTYFREPLATLGLLTTAFFLERWRRALTNEERRQRRWMAFAGLALIVALLSKESTLIALPALVLLAYPGWQIVQRYRRQVLIIAGVGLLLGIGLAVSLFIFREMFQGVDARYEIARRAGQLLSGLSTAGPGIAGYLLSPGKGIWWFSPILLLALTGPFLAERERWRETWLPLGLTLWFALVYAAVLQELWFGGQGWGARYMVPLVPFLMIAALPAIDRLLNHERIVAQIGLIVLAFIGFAIQLAGNLVFWASYDGYIIRNTGQAPWEQAGIWTFRWSQAFGSFFYLPGSQPDIAWWTPNADIAVLAVILIALMTVSGLLAILARPSALPPKPVPVLIWSMPLWIAAVVLFSLWRINDDPRYQGQNPDLRALHQSLLAVNADHHIMLSQDSYALNFMNYYKGDAIWYALPTSPGARYSCDHQPAVQSDQVEELIHPQARQMAIENVAPGGRLANDQPVWLVVDNSPLVPCANRPVEWAISKYMYPYYIEDFGQHVRLVAYYPWRAPLADTMPEQMLNLRFGEDILLVGSDIRHEEDRIGVSLLWEAQDLIQQDYTVAVFVIGPNGLPVLQRDTTPQNGFAPTSQWMPGIPQRDNYGFQLTDELPPGEYQLWVVMYSWPSLERLDIRDRTGDLIGDHVVLGTFMQE
ncbi:MAG: phospholipid carrier-dependent glycosyltransferase [Chloroflexi bacterium]|nr:phospholipid carrier-dependent glycosyltransferase [Chloroflexota bacterium]